ncbi:hypothetical protein COLO4_07388 [Corchorus olitorius]|uniref:PGG domain-containing protein n=1 Tax=Corchorus olitorius TaxID=93759 RepID=A0A1R3KJZ0_9ROSI|nr:hypothetical protein COLO4_07388 [Corchorus olitorius]
MDHPGESRGGNATEVDAKSRLESLMHGGEGEGDAICDYDDNQVAVNKSLYEAAAQRGIDGEIAFANKLEDIAITSKLPLKVMCNRVSPYGNSLLHVAAASGAQEITKLLLHFFPELIISQNKEGDTPLHIAAKAARLNICKLLLQHKYGGAANDITLLRMENQSGNTALHEAIINYYRKYKNECGWSYTSTISNSNHEVITSRPECDLIQYLIHVDPELLCHENKDHESPIYMAVQYGNNPQVLELIHKYWRQHNLENDQTIHGKSPVHAAIEKKNQVMLKLLITLDPKLLYLPDDHDNKRIPLHQAAWLGNYEAVKYLLEQDEDKLAIHQKDNDGLYPLHCACMNGDFNIVKILCNQWPDPMEFISEKRQQNILHVAAENGVDRVLLYILNNLLVMRKSGIVNPSVENVNRSLERKKYIVNAKDKDGNTALHLAASTGHCFCVGYLLKDRMVDPDIVNNDGFTAYDVASNRSLGVHHESKPQTQNDENKSEDHPNPKANCRGLSQVEKNQSLYTSSLRIKRPYSFLAMMCLSLLYVSHCKSYWRDRIKKLPKPSQEETISKEDFRQSISNLIVVATLIAGIAFAAAVQMPGSGNSGNTAEMISPSTSVNINPPNQAKAKAKLHEENFESSINHFAFFISVALQSAILAAITLCWAQVVNINLAIYAGWIASMFVGSALMMMFVAFICQYFTALNPWKPVEVSVSPSRVLLHLLVLLLPCPYGKLLSKPST